MIGVEPVDTRKAIILPANALLFLVGVLDLISTLWWVHTGRAVEYNPVMAAVLDAGVPAFVAVKMSTLIVFVVVMEWYRRRRCALFARAVGLFTLIAYASIYTVSLLVVNKDCIL